SREWQIEARRTAVWKERRPEPQRSHSVCELAASSYCRSQQGPPAVHSWPRVLELNPDNSKPIVRGFVVSIRKHDASTRLDPFDSTIGVPRWKKPQKSADWNSSRRFE